MEDIVDLPIFGEFQLICHMTDRFGYYKWSISFCSELVGWMRSFEVLRIKPYLLPFLIWSEVGILDQKHLAVQDSLMGPFSDVFYLFLLQNQTQTGLCWSSIPFWHYPNQGFKWGYF